MLDGKHYLNADKHSHASSARSDCVHEQVAKRIANVRFTNICSSNTSGRLIELRSPLF